VRDIVLNKRKIGRVYTNLRGWRTSRKIMIIESDDWGSVRMPSKDVYDKCLRAGYPVDKRPYERYDSIASEEDLELLFNLLSSYKDIKGNHPIITANCLVANPDFEKIKADNYNNYHYELITETFKKYPKHSNNFNLWKQGMNSKVFHPQYHGREHVNVSLLLGDLQKGKENAHFGFANGMPGCIPLGPKAIGNRYVEAMRYSSIKDKKDKLNIYLEGLDIFERLFGFRSYSIIPPNYIWSLDYNEAVNKSGVKFIQSIRMIKEPVIGKDKVIKHDIYLGKKNKFGQVYGVRNVTFEPTSVKKGVQSFVDQCLMEMNIAFKMGKPAVISSHRINYVGFIDPGNRDRSLNMLEQILTTAIKRWPDLEFMTSDQLGRIILGHNYENN